MLEDSGWILSFLNETKQKMYGLNLHSGLGVWKNVESKILKWIFLPLVLIPSPHCIWSGRKHLDHSSGFQTYDLLQDVPWRKSNNIENK